MKYFYSILLCSLILCCKKDLKPGLSEKLMKFENGNIKRRHFEDKNGLIQDTMWDYYSTGELSKIRLFKNSQQHGRSVYYLKEGQVYEIQHYDEGKIVGVDTVFHPDGKIKVLANFVNGMRNGFFKVFKENGELETEYNYRNDSLIIEKKIEFK